MSSYQESINSEVRRERVPKTKLGGIAVFIVDDHAIIREGLRALLSLESSIDVVGESSDGRDAIRKVGALNPDLVLMDLSMPGINGIEAIRQIKNRNPNLRVVVLTAHRSDEYIRIALEAGANGYLLKESTRAELLIAIRSVMAGKSYLSPVVSEKIIVGYLNRGDVHAKSPWETLTARERVVLKLIAEGHQNKRIANYLSISVKTVEKHRANMMSKLNLHNAARLTAYAIERQLVTR